MSYIYIKEMSLCFFYLFIRNIISKVAFGIFLYRVVGVFNLYFRCFLITNFSFFFRVIFRSQQGTVGQFESIIFLFIHATVFSVSSLPVWSVWQVCGSVLNNVINKALSLSIHWYLDLRVCQLTSFLSYELSLGRFFALCLRPKIRVPSDLQVH